MKKLKKLLAGVLTLAMAMSMMTMTAFAAPNIDQDATGSITIHKLNYKMSEEEAKNYQGTGTEADADNLPSTATPLPDVEFTIYKVVDKDALLNYYSGDASKYDGSISTAPYLNEDGSAIDSLTAAKPAAKTNANGVVDFTGLDLGIYLVIETDHPDSVSTPTKPFLVSIPMTNPNNSEWLYDVHVYPKNATDTMTDAIELWKWGRVAGSEAKSPLNGVVFVLQKKQKDGTWKTITKQTSGGIDDAGAALNLVTVDGKISVTGLSAGEYRFIERSLGKDEAGNDLNPGYILDGATTYNFEIKMDEATKKLMAVYTAPGAVVDAAGKLGDTAEDKFDSTDHPHFEVINEQPKFDKEIKDDKKDDNSEYGVGDVITYSIAVGVPEKIAKLKVFYVKDTPINLAVQNGSLKVFTMGDDGKPVDITSEIGTGVDYTDDGGFRLDFTTGADAAINAYAGKEITIEYKAVVLQSAEGSVMNTNDAKLTYSDKIKPGEEDGDNPNHDLDEKVYVKEDKTVSYTYQFKVIKTAGESGDPLPEVEFDLYKDVTDSVLDESYLETVGLEIITGDAAEAIGLKGTDEGGEAVYWLKVNKDSLKTDSNGEVTQGGLGKGTYYLVETKTAKGYNLLDEPFLVTLTLESSTTVNKEWTKVDKYEDGELVLEGVWVEKATTSTTSWPGTAADGIFKQPVVNRKGFTLPSTGGMGTFLFTFVGVAMMAAAVILFITSKKKEAK